jgi:hypothetical protein
MNVQLHDFPVGTSYYFCHTGSAYPTGGSVPNLYWSRTRPLGLTSALMLVLVLPLVVGRGLR